MLKRANRLHLERDFARVRSKGRIARGKLFALRYLANTEEANCRCAFVVSKKLSKKAVERNKVTRWAREAFQALLPFLNGSWYILVVAQKQFQDYSFISCREEIKQLLKNAKLIS